MTICNVVGKRKLFYGHEPSSGESTTTECAVNYQLLAVMLLKLPNGELRCSRPQLATDNGVRDSDPFD